MVQERQHSDSSISSRSINTENNSTSNTSSIPSVWFFPLVSSSFKSSSSSSSVSSRNPIHPTIMNSIRLTRKVPHRQPTPHPRKSSLCHSTKRVYVLGLLIVAAMMTSHRQGRFENTNNFYTDDDVVTPMGGNTIWPSSKSDMQLLLRRATQQVQHDEMNGVDFFWQLPPPLTNPSPHSSSDNIQGILLLLFLNSLYQ